MKTQEKQCSNEQWQKKKKVFIFFTFILSPEKWAEHAIAIKKKQQNIDMKNQLLQKKIE